jgi:periplasmic protein CpxP/Spy
MVPEGNQMQNQNDRIKRSSVMSNINSHDSVTPSPRSPRRRRWLALLLLPLAAGVLFASVAKAHGFGGPRGGGGAAFMQERMEHLLSAAGASDAQKAQIKAIWDKQRPQLQAAHKQQHETRQQMGVLLAAATIDVARVEQLRKQSVDAMDKISSAMTQAMVASAQVLTPDQRKVVLQKLEERRRHHRGPDRD